MHDRIYVIDETLYATGTSTDDEPDGMAAHGISLAEVEKAIAAERTRRGLVSVDVWAGENVEHDGTYYRDATVFVSEVEPAVDCEHLFVAVQEAGKRAGDVWRIADSIGVAQRDDEDTYQWLERAVADLKQRVSPGPAIIGSTSCETRFGTWGDPPAPRTDRRRPRIFTFVNGSEIDVDRYLGLDATAISRTDHGDLPAITFQLGHGGFLRVAFASEQQRVDELARLRAFRDGAA
jgi:hypothetical protein